MPMVDRIKTWEVKARVLGYLAGATGVLVWTRSPTGSWVRTVGVLSIGLMVVAFAAAYVFRIVAQWRAIHRPPTARPRVLWPRP